MTLPLVIDRPCARQSCGLLAAIYLSGALALPAHAHSFDLECVVLDASGNVNYSQQGKHLQVNLESGQWCEERCSEIGEGAHLQESGQLVLKDGEDYFGQSALLYYVPDEKLLVDVFDLGGRFERVSNYTCSEDAVGGLEPYLAEPAYPRSMNRLWSLFQPANLPDGFTRPSEDGTEEVRRELSADEYATFLARVEESCLWKRLPESWMRAPDTFCAHGRHVVLEKHDAAGYGMSDAEHCTAPANMVRVLDAMLDLARFESRAHWRPGMWW